MISHALRLTAEELGFTYAESGGRSGLDSLYGVYGGYLVTLYDAGSQKTCFINYHLNTETEEDDPVRLLEISEALKTAFSGLSVSNYSVEADGLSCTMSGSQDDFFALLDRVLAMLAEQGVRGVTHCSCCGNRIGKRLPKKLSRQRKHYLLCEHCALDKLESASKTPEGGADALPKHTGKGVLGAIAGGVIGFLLYVLIYAFLSPLFSDSAFEVRYLFCLLGVAAAWLVYTGFRFFSKRPCVSAHIVISAVTVVSVALGQYFGSFVGYAKQMEFTLAQAARLRSMWLIHLRSTVDTSWITDPSTVSAEMQAILDRYDVASLFYKLLLFSLLFALIGSIFFQLSLREKVTVKKEQLEIETLRITPSEEPESEH